MSLRAAGGGGCLKGRLTIAAVPACVQHKRPEPVGRAELPAQEEADVFPAVSGALLSEGDSRTRSPGQCQDSFHWGHAHKATGLPGLPLVLPRGFAPMGQLARPLLCCRPRLVREQRPQWSRLQEAAFLCPASFTRPPHPPSHLRGIKCERPLSAGGANYMGRSLQSLTGPLGGVAPGSLGAASRVSLHWPHMERPVIRAAFLPPAGSVGLHLAQQPHVAARAPQ